MGTLSEFDLIDLFTRPLPRRGEGVRVGIGDDAAVLAPPRGELLLATVDAVVEGVHFSPETPPADTGWKSLAVNLSDLAAMGARPLWALVALGLPPRIAPARLAAIAGGLGDCARRYRIAVVGGNVTRASELSITVTVAGCARAGAILTRDGGRPGDVVVVSGTLGDAALGLEPGSPRACQARQRRPIPRLALGRALAPLASACIDLSDGLLQDLGHLCHASRVGARVRLGELPLSPAYRRATRRRGDPYALAVAGGEDYELCCTIPPARLSRALAQARRLDVPLTAIGEVVAGRGVRAALPGGEPYAPSRRGHDHLAFDFAPEGRRIGRSRKRGRRRVAKRS